MCDCGGRNSAETWRAEIVDDGVAEDPGVIAEIDPESEGKSPPFDGFLDEDGTPRLDDVAAAARCGTSHIRRKVVNGVCYCQMCCGGTWYFFYWIVNGRRVYQRCGMRGRTVKCAGHNYILTCR